MAKKTKSALEELRQQYIDDMVAEIEAESARELRQSELRHQQVMQQKKSRLNQLKDLILTVLPKQIIYISCNPSTLAKDIAVLSEKYNIKYIQPVDMFPYTAHVESVVLLELKK